MVIGSAAPSANIDFFMKRLGVGHYFKGFIGEEDVKHGKPSPEVFKKAVQLLDLPPQDCIVFEDSTKGAEAASKAGIKTIAVLSTKSKVDFKDHPDVIGFIKDYTELLEDQSEKS